MGLPWLEWGETAVLLTGALHTLEAMTCPCGCGQPVDEAHDEANADRYQPHVVTCYARKSLAAFRADHKDDLDEATLVYVTLLPEGEQVVDPLSSTGYDPDRARAAYEAHMRKWGQSV